jgi:hypothetical protein
MCFRTEFFCGKTIFLTKAVIIVPLVAGPLPKLKLVKDLASVGS